MEFQPSFLVIASLLILVIWLSKICKQKVKGESVVHNKIPPGPRKLPLIGNLHQMARAGTLPHHTLQNLAHKYGPLMHLQLGEIPAVVISSPEMAKEVMKTHDLTFVDRPQLLCPQILAYGSTDIAFAPYGDYWRQMRKICTLELLSAKRVQSFSYIREDEVAKLIRSIHLSASAGSPVNVSKSVFSLVSTFVTRAAFGKKSEYEDELLTLLKKAVELAAGFDLDDLFPSMKPIHLITRMKAKLENMQKKLDKILEHILKEHQSNHDNSEAKETLVDVLLRVQQSGSLEIPVTLNNIKAVIWDVFVAGSDSSSTILEWAMSELTKNPLVMKKAQTEIREACRGKKIISEADLHELGYLKSVIKETMRLHPPAPLLLPRECREACKIGGYEIPMKTKVIVNAWALGRDPKHWYDAEKFIPERFHGSGVDFNGNNFEYIPFGAGRRICPGILLGIANIELPLASLLYHFEWELPNGIKPEDLDMTETFGAVAGRRDNLFLIPTPYNNF
ncbi:cytochrome P450 71D8-like [Abrus precatorius]|uniref:Cytochrome P450 71D8-like n=1 Tax=Abrus precatorius TaxID=3816 RepID=A0A8B8MJ84_ABRPR|nr:cytochrome P450 71D8-like [Abrus precatorius]